MREDTFASMAKTRIPWRFTLLVRGYSSFCLIKSNAEYQTKGSKFGWWFSLRVLLTFGANLNRKTDENFVCYLVLIWQDLGRSLERVSNDCRKTKTKVTTPINHNRSKQRHEPIKISRNTCNSLEAREKSRVHGAIGFGFASHWLKYCRDSFKPITKRSNRNRVITFNSHLKTALNNN